jgi:hypothetical protein
LGSAVLHRRLDGLERSSVENLLRVYGHIDLIDLSEIDALYESGKVVPLRPVESVGVLLPGVTFRGPCPASSSCSR